jgi:hypothetical protein
MIWIVPAGSPPAGAMRHGDNAAEVTSRPFCREKQYTPNNCQAVRSDVAGFTVQTHRRSLVDPDPEIPTRWCSGAATGGS